MNSEPNRPVLTVAVGGFNPFPEGVLAQGLQHGMGNSVRLELIEHKFAKNLLDSGIQHPWQLCLMFINPYIPWVEEDWSPPQHQAPAILDHIKRASNTPLVVWHNGLSGFNTVDFFSAGADAVFSMPFSFEAFAETMRRLLNLSAAPGGAAQANLASLPLLSVLVGDCESQFSEIFAAAFQEAFHNRYVVRVSHRAFWDELEESARRDGFDLMIVNLTAMTDRRPNWKVWPDTTVEHVERFKTLFGKPIIVMSSWREDGLRERLELAGADAYLDMPCNGAEIISAVRDCLSHVPDGD